MSVNRGKQFEDVVKGAFEQVPNTLVLRLHDQTTGYIGSKNICDFIVYRQPYMYCIECKSVHGNTLPFANITDTQWRGLQNARGNVGVEAGILCWWIDKDVTAFISISTLARMKSDGKLSIRYDDPKLYIISGKKRRVFFDYEMGVFLEQYPKDVF